MVYLLIYTWELYLLVVLQFKKTASFRTSRVTRVIYVQWKSSSKQIHIKLWSKADITQDYSLFRNEPISIYFTFPAAFWLVK